MHILTLFLPNKIILAPSYFFTQGPQEKTEIGAEHFPIRDQNTWIHIRYCMLYGVSVHLGYGHLDVIHPLGHLADPGVVHILDEGVVL